MKYNYVHTFTNQQRRQFQSDNKISKPRNISKQTMNLILLCVCLVMGQPCAEMVETLSTNKSGTWHQNINLKSLVYNDIDTSYSVNFSSTASEPDQIKNDNISHTPEHNATGQTHSGNISDTHLGINTSNQSHSVSYDNIIPVSDTTNEIYSNIIGKENLESDTNDDTHTGNFNHATSGSSTTDRSTFNITNSVHDTNKDAEIIYTTQRYHKITEILSPSISSITNNEMYSIHLRRISLFSDIDIRMNETDSLLVNRIISELIDETYTTDYSYTDITNVKFTNDYKVNNESKLEVEVDDQDKRDDKEENGTDVREREDKIVNGDTREYEDEEDVFDAGVYLKAYIIWNLIGFCGIVANICLIMVFVLRKEMRTYSNVMVMNLTISDILCIVFNAQLHLLQTPLATWPAYDFLCKAYFWARSLAIGSSIYCVVTISLQRFFALTNFFTFNTSQHVSVGKHKPFLFVLFVWILAGVLASRYFANAILEDSMCFFDSVSFGKSNDMVDFLVYSAIPLLIIGFSSVLTSIRLKKSARNMPGEVSVTNNAKKDRAVSSNVLLALTIVFGTSYVPLYSYYFYSSWNDSDVDLDMDTMFYGLIFINSCFNPIALFTMCRKYRRILLRDIICRKNCGCST